MSGWGNLIDSSKPYHAIAADFYRNARQLSFRLITSNYVLAELVALLESSLRIPRNQAIAFFRSVKASSMVEVLHIDLDLDAEAWQSLEARPDKSWSLVDCSSFVIMQQRGITSA